MKNQNEIPEESTEQSTWTTELKFKTERAKNSFLYYVQAVREGKINNPALAVVFDQLVEKPYE